MRVFARTWYKPLIDVDPMVQVAAIRIYYNLIVPIHVLLERAARQCDRSTQEALNKTSRCATWLHGCPPHHIIHTTLTEKKINHPKQDLPVFCSYDAVPCTYLVV
jgi:hypothetical protein